MSWQDETIPMLRVLINDLSASPTYSDDRLEQTLIVAAKLVYQDIDISYTYTISIENVSISPDPTTNSDDAFLNFIVLKAACIADQSTFRTKAALEGIRAALGPASLSVGGHLPGFKTLLELGPCATYTEMKEQFEFGNVNIVKGILSPFVGNRFDPKTLYGYDTRRENS
jgi:hypothetical protein